LSIYALTNINPNKLLKWRLGPAIIVIPGDKPPLNVPDKAILRIGILVGMVSFLLKKQESAKVVTFFTDPDFLRRSKRLDLSIILTLI
jgi:hypothetical protein